MIIIAAKHFGKDKKYIFQVPFSDRAAERIAVGDILFVETARGKTIAIAESETVEGKGAERIAALLGAHLPLKSVLGVLSKANFEILLNSLGFSDKSSDLPF